MTNFSMIVVCNIRVDKKIQSWGHYFENFHENHVELNISFENNCCNIQFLIVSKCLFESYSIMNNSNVVGVTVFEIKTNKVKEKFLKCIFFID